MRSRPRRSCNSVLPIIAAKITEVSRNTATAAIGAWTIAHSTIP